MTNNYIAPHTVPLLNSYHVILWILYTKSISDHSDYCDVVYDSNLTVTYAMRLEYTELKIALVTGAHRRSPISDLLRDVGWETLKTRRAIHNQKHCIKSTRKALLRQIISIISLFPRAPRKHWEPHEIQIAWQLTNIVWPPSVTRSFPDAVSKWNSLSPDTQSQPTLKSFGKTVAKHHVLKEAPRYFSLGPNWITN